MTYKIAYWDDGVHIRDATPEEVADIVSRQNAGQPVPDSVPMLNVRLALIAAGLLDSVTAFFNNMASPDGDEARTYWDYASNVRRDNKWVESARISLGLTSQEIDQLFINAAKIV